MRIRIRIHVRTHIYIPNLHMHKHISIQNIYIHEHAHTHTYLQIQIHIRMHIWICIYVPLKSCRRKMRDARRFGIVQARNARCSSLLEPCKCEKREARRFWNRASAKCEKLAFGIAQARNVRCSSLLESRRREMSEVRRFWSRACAKCETVVAFAWRRCNPRNSPGFWVPQQDSILATPLKKKVRHTLEKMKPLRHLVNGRSHALLQSQARPCHRLPDEVV